MAVITLAPVVIQGTSSPLTEVRIFDRRQWKVTVAGTTVAISDTTLEGGIDVAFEISKSKKPEPNSCRLKLFNLSKDSRDYLAGLSLVQKQNSKGTGKGSFKQVGVQAGNIRVEVEAGYNDTGASLIFRGDLRTASSERDGTDIVTTIWGEDGGYSSLTARVSGSFPPGTPFESVARFCAARMGVGVGNLAAVFNGGLPGVNSSLFTTFAEGTTLSGSAQDNLRGILAGLGVTYSIQDGVIQCRTKKGFIPSTTVILSPTTGLVGSPIKDANGFVKATCLIQPGLFVDGRVRFDTADFQGDYVIWDINYQGETYGKTWYAAIECKAPSGG